VTAACWTTASGRSHARSGEGGGWATPLRLSLVNASTYMVYMRMNDVVIAHLEVMADSLEMMFQRRSAAHELGDGLARHMSNLYGAVLIYSQRRVIQNTPA
jgi:hypothetical protein